MLTDNIIEPLRVKQQVIKSAAEAACMLLRIDGPAGGPGLIMPGGMPGGMPPDMM
jgi:hypothetical protein